MKCWKIRADTAAVLYWSTPKPETLCCGSPPSRMVTMFRFNSADAYYREDARTLTHRMIARQRYLHGTLAQKRRFPLSKTIVNVARYSQKLLPMLIP